MNETELNEIQKRIDEAKEQAERQVEESIEIQTDSEPKEMPISTFEEKALTDITFSDVKFKLDTSKDFQTQVEDVLGGVVTASAVQDETVQKELKDKKAEELVNKAKKKASDAQKDAIEAETEVQKAERSLYEAVLQTFGITKHLPRFLMKILVYIFSPLYVFLTILIGLPCAFVKIIIDNLDGIICRYEETKDGTKPKIKVVSWMLFSILILGIIALTVLKCVGKI